MKKNQEIETFYFRFKEDTHCLVLHFSKCAPCCSSEKNDVIIQTISFDILSVFQKYLPPS